MNLIQWITAKARRTKAPDYRPINWFQFGEHSKRGATDVERFGPVYSCVKIIAEEIARLHLQHLRMSDGQREVITTSAASRVFHTPNTYQTRSDFWLAMVYSLLYTGNAYAVATRNSRSEIEALWPQRGNSGRPMVDPFSNEIFYSFASQDVDPLDPMYAYPARDVLHIRLFTPRDPLVGETPISAAMAAIVSGQAQRDSEAAFFANQSRPSGVITVDAALTEKKMLELRRSWDEQAKGLAIGRIPIFHSGMKWQPLGMSATDAQAVESYKMSVDDIARIFRMPPFMLGDLNKATYSNTEQMTRTFYVSCLGFYVEHLEAALNKLFGFRQSETANFDVESGLLRGDFEQRISGLTKGVQGGVYRPNEARAREYLPPVEGGDNLLVQQQMIPVDQAGQSQAAPAAPEPEPEPEPKGLKIDYEKRNLELLREYAA